jgi:O-methyltransferase
MQAIRKIIRSFGFDVQRFYAEGHEKFPHAVDPEFVTIYRKYRSYTMLNWISLYNVYNAIKYIVKSDIPGSLVECGVWRGGCVGFMLDTLKLCGDEMREVYLYDTFEGLPPPGPEDRHSNRGFAANDMFEEFAAKGEKWCYASEEDVRRTVALAKYPDDKIHFVKGKVEDTIPTTLPGKTALLRLDTDWYESTKHEMEHLYPLLQKRGVLIVDDYGVWTGSRKAVDEYFEKIKKPMYFVFDERVVAATGIKTED